MPAADFRHGLLRQLRYFATRRRRRAAVLPDARVLFFRQREAPCLTPGRYLRCRCFRAFDDFFAARSPPPRLSPFLRAIFVSFPMLSPPVFRWRFHDVLAFSLRRPIYRYSLPLFFSFSAISFFDVISTPFFRLHDFFRYFDMKIIYITMI